MNEDHVSRRVARAMVHLQHLFSETHFVAVVQPTVRHKGLAGRKPKLVTPLRQGVEQKAVVLVRPFDRKPQFARHPADCAHVIEVAMGDQDLLQA